jgi:hypothetical protein
MTCLLLTKYTLLDLRGKLVVNIVSGVVQEDVVVAVVTHTVVLVTGPCRSCAVSGTVQQGVVHAYVVGFTEHTRVRPLDLAGLPLAIQVHAVAGVDALVHQQICLS